MSRIRVLRVIARMNVGGPALQVVNLQRGLDPERFKTRLLVGTVADDEADYLQLRAPEIEAQVISGLGRAVRPLDDLRALGEVLSHIREFQPHIVHSHTAKAGVLARLAARRAGVPCIVHTFHGHLLHGYFSPPLTLGVRLVERTLAGKTTRLLAVGAQVRDELIEAGIGRPDQYSVMPPGVALQPVPSRAEARAALGLPQDVRVIAFVGRLTQIKRPDRALDVLARLVPEHADLVLAVVGEGPLFEHTSQEAAPFGSAVRMLGWRSDVETVYGAADLVLLTSDNEGMPVALIEAGLAGVPAVTTRVGSAAEVVADGRTGFVTDPESGALAAAVSRLLKDDALRVQFGAAAREYARARFSAERLVRDTEALYEELVLRQSEGSSG